MIVKHKVFDFGLLLLFLVSLLGSSGASSATSPLAAYGKAIELPFPNDWDILGVSGLTYNKETDFWTCSAENIPGTDVARQFPTTSLPRLYHMRLDFKNGAILEVGNDDSSVLVDPSQGLKLEDVTQAPPTTDGDSSGDFWVVSEANSHLATTNKFFSKDFGAPDLSTFDPMTYETSRLVRVDGITGAIVETASVPDFAQWDGTYDWDALQCVGDRPFQGLHAISIIPTSSADGNGETQKEHVMIIGIQAALYQDGPTANEFDGSATRLLYYKINSSDGTATYDKSYRYDTSQLTIDTYQKGARHMNALFGLLALNETSILITECEEFLGFGSSSHKVINRIFHVALDPTKTVDHCHSLLDCDVPAPTKRLIWERRNDNKQLDGIALGPMVTIEETGETIPTVALAYENDDRFGVYFELFTLNESAIANSPVWKENDTKEEAKLSRITAVSVSSAVIFVLVLIQIFCVRYVLNKSRPDHSLEKQQHQASKKASFESQSSLRRSLRFATEQAEKVKFKHWALGVSMFNSFLVGGVTFGWIGMSLILRQEGTFADQCACGSYCAAEKEQLALISTVGFAVAIGSRLFIGLFLDAHGPKVTSVLCSVICLAGFIVLGASPSEKLANNFIWGWIILSLGGSGLHIVGFHMTNNFKGESKKVASACISAAFGASSAVFPIWQILNQYAGVSLQSMAQGYSVIVLLVGLTNFFVQPWNKVQPGVPLKPNFKVWRRSWWDQGGKRSKPLVVSTIFELMQRFEFWGECIFYSINLLLLTYYLSTAGAFLFEKGDAKFTLNPNDPTDYIFSRMAGWLNSLGFLWYPATKLLLLKTQWSPKFEAVMAANFVVAVVVAAVPQLELQVIGMVLLSFSRLMLFSFHHAFIIEKFGIEYFGILNGISSFFAAILGLVNYPLQLMAVRVGSYSMIFVPIGILVLLTIAFPLCLRRVPVSNWAESYTVDPRKFRRPETIKELIELIHKNEEVRCVGAMHSCAPLVMSDGIIISFEKLNKILEVDAQNATATVQPGVKIHDLCEAIKPHGLALGTLGTIDWQTVVGAVMTGTHGGSLTTPSLHDFVESYTLVKADGEFMTVTREDNPKLFSAMAPCMGVFGVVVECKIRLVKLTYLEAEMESMPFKDVIPMFKDLMEGNTYARVVVYPSLDLATVWKANPIEKKGDAVARGAFKSKGYINFRDEHEKAWLEEFLVHQKRGAYEKADDFLKKTVNSQLIRLSHYEGEYNHILCKERNHGIPHADIEFGMDFAKAEEVLTAVREWYLTKGNRVPYYNFEIRTTKQDYAMMSCCYARDTLFIDFQAKASVGSHFFPKMEELMAPFGYRKHWAKGMCHSNPGYIVSQFPNVEQFIELMGEHDPKGKFRNEHIRLWYDKIKENLANTQKTPTDEQEKAEDLAPGE